MLVRVTVKMAIRLATVRHQAPAMTVNTTRAGIYKPFQENRRWMPCSKRAVSGRKLFPAPRRVQSWKDPANCICTSRCVSCQFRMASLKCAAARSKSSFSRLIFSREAAILSSVART